LRENVDVTDELLYGTRKRIESEALRMVKSGACVGAGELSFNAERLR
jgi:hypothetical protein